MQGVSEDLQAGTAKPLAQAGSICSSERRPCTDTYFENESSAAGCARGAIPATNSFSGSCLRKDADRPPRQEEAALGGEGRLPIARDFGRRSGLRPPASEPSRLAYADMARRCHALGL